MNKIIFYAFFFIVCCSCSDTKDPVSELKYECPCEKNQLTGAENLIGRWKLEKSMFFDTGAVVKELQNTIYDLRANGILIITNEGDPDSVERSYQLSEEGTVLTINQSKSSCRFSDTHLEINYSWIDGPVECFVKL